MVTGKKTAYNIKTHWKNMIVGLILGEKSKLETQIKIEDYLLNHF